MAVPRFFFLCILFGHGVGAFLSQRRQWSGPSGSPLALLTPTTVARVDDLIQKRNQARKIQDFEAADALLQQVSLDLPLQCSIRVTDTLEGYSQWSVLYHIPTHDDNNNSTTPSVLQLAHMTLGSRVAASEQQNWDSVALNNARNQLVQQAKEKLQAWSRVHSNLSTHLTFHRDVPSSQMNKEQWQTLLQTTDLTVWASIESDLQGRKSADAAFWFALAGVRDKELFSLLTDVVSKELSRFGTRPSCRLKDVTSMAKRMAAAGVRNHTQLEHVLQRCLEAKDATMSSAEVLSFHSDGCALMLWEFSTRQRKQKSFLDQAARHWRNAELPVGSEMIDVGCGMGVCLLGLASLSGKDASQWDHVNFLGIDLNPVTIGYGSGIAQRWNLSDRLAFVVDAAENALQTVLEFYPGPVSKILVQFPTPYRLNNKPDDETSAQGNAQLPSSVTDGFMVSTELLRLCRDILVRNSGELWIQSNCEDVAVWMRRTACDDAGFSYTEILEDFIDTPNDNIPMKETQRTMQWIAMGGERAQGPGWCTTHILPRSAMTETEVACIVKGTPVHRCILSPQSMYRIQKMNPAV